MKALSANLRWLFQEWPLLERIEVAARVGLRAVDASLPYEVPAAELARRLEANGLAFVYMLTPSGDWAVGEMGLAALPGREREFREGVEVAIDYAAAVGGPLLHAAAGNLPPGTDPARSRDVYLENLAYAADRAAVAGLTVGIEPLCRASHPRFALSRVDDAVEVIGALGRANLRLIFDTYAATMEHGAIAPLLQRHHPLIAHLQVANPPDRREPGAGELDFDWLFGLLQRLGYAGWVSAEYRPTRGTLDSLHWARRFGVVPERAA